MTKQDTEQSWSILITMHGKSDVTHTSPAPFQYEHVNAQPGTWIVETMGWGGVFTDVKEIMDSATAPLVDRMQREEYGSGRKRSGLAAPKQDTVPAPKSTR